MRENESGEHLRSSGRWITAGSTASPARWPTSSTRSSSTAGSRKPPARSRRIIRLGSLSDICRELGHDRSGRNTQSIKKVLHQNASAYITAKIRYRQSDGSERTLEAGFTRYSVVFTGEKLPDGRKADAVYIVLNDIYMQVINGAMTRPLDYDYLKSLPPAPQRFYELLSYRMYAALKNDRPRAKLVYSEFCTYAPQTRHLDWERVRSQMNKIHRPHQKSGYIAEVDFEQTVDGDGQPDWIMLYPPGPKARAEYRAFARRGGPAVLEVEPLVLDPSPRPAAPGPSPLEAELIGRGITPAVAADLVREHGEEKVRLQIDILDWPAREEASQDRRPGRLPRDGHPERPCRPQRLRQPRRASGPRGGPAGPGTRGGRGSPPAAGGGGPRAGDPGGSGRLSQAADSGRAGGAGSRGAGPGRSRGEVGPARRPARRDTGPPCCWAWCGSTWRGSSRGRPHRRRAHPDTTHPPGSTAGRRPSALASRRGRPRPGPHRPADPGRCPGQHRPADGATPAAGTS